MKPTVKRTLIIVIIIAIAIAAGFCVDTVWSLLEKNTHPNDYSDIVEKYAAEYNIPPEVIFAVIKTESNFDPNARSSAGALGLMQMTPIALKDVDPEEKIKFEDLTDPDLNIRCGTCYLSILYRAFDYNWHNAIAAYNGGWGRIGKLLENPDNVDSEGNLIYFPPELQETRSYVFKVKKAIDTYKELYAK